MNFGEFYQKLLWMHRHDDLLEEMGHSGRQIIENYSPRRFAENIKTLFDSRYGTLTRDDESELGT